MREGSNPVEIFRAKADVLQQKMIEGSIQADEGFKELQRLAEETFDPIKGPEQFARAQIELIVYRASLLRGLGRLDEARAELADALTYAGNMGFEDIVRKLRAQGKEPTKEELMQALVGALRELELSEDQIQTIVEETDSYEEAFMNATKFLLEEGYGDDVVNELLAILKRKGIYEEV